MCARVPVVPVRRNKIDELLNYKAPGARGFVIIVINLSSGVINNGLEKIHKCHFYGRDAHGVYIR
jgi:hypothetical protein